MNQAPSKQIDEGTAYGMKPSTYRRELVEVGAGTPMGELMRRYWQPCFTSTDLTSDRPRRVRLLGEDLILFRDKAGKPGLVHEKCCHRGSSLFYGRIEEDGIRCCYHGWKFDVQGRCLAQAAEPNGGRKNGVRQPWYPVEERYGLVYAYMGPPERKPLLPRWKQFEDLGPGEVIEARWRPHYGPLVEGPDAYEMNPLPFNWLATFENTVDGPHLPWLHYHHSGDQFTGQTLVEDPVELPPYAQIENMSARIIQTATPLGVRQAAPMAGPNGTELLVATEAIIPNMAVIPGFIDLLYTVPVDDTHFVQFMVWRSEFHGQRSNLVELHHGKTWYEMTDLERQMWPGDYEAQSSIGELPAHSREHLTRGDTAVVMLRRRLEQEVRNVAEGRDPTVLSFDENDPPFESTAHGFIPYEEKEA